MTLPLVIPAGVGTRNAVNANVRTAKSIGRKTPRSTKADTKIIWNITEQNVAEDTISAISTLSALGYGKPKYFGNTA